jgi:hypothetical protein
MKGKQLAFLLLLVVVIGGAGWYYQKGSQESWAAKGSGGAGAKVLDLKINDVARVTVKASGAEVNLVKKDDAWTVQERTNYPANFEQVSNLLRKLWDLKTVQQVKVGPSQFARLELVEPDKGAGTGTLVEFKDKDGKALGGLLLGKKFTKKSDMAFGDMGGFAAGRYVMPVGAAQVSLVSETLDEVSTKPESWLVRDFFKIENPKSVTLAGTTDPQHWKLTRETVSAEWKLDGLKEEEKVDVAKTGPVGTAFTSPSFVDVLAPDAKPEDTGLDKPAVATFETFDGFTYTLKIGKATGENYPLTVEIAAMLAAERTPGKDEKPEDKTKLDEEFKTTHKRLEDKLAAEKKIEGRPYLVAKSTVDQLLKDRSYFIAEKKPETPAPAASPGTSATTPPVSVTTPPVTATTPPVAAPPAPTPGNPPAPKPAPPGTPKPDAAPAADSPAKPEPPAPPKPDAAPAAKPEPPPPPKPEEKKE